MSLAVANQYAKALLGVVTKSGSALAPETALDQVSLVAATIQQSPELRSLMVTPAITREKKGHALKRVGDLMGLDPVIQNFLRVVILHRRVPLLGAIASMLRLQIDERAGVSRAHVTAAQPLAEDQKTNLVQALAGMTGKKIICEYSVDPSLVGGLTVKIGSTVYDGSVHGQLDALRRRLASQS